LRATACGEPAIVVEQVVSHPAALYPGDVTLSELEKGIEARIVTIEGERAFRRRLLELGLVPGTSVRLLRVAPLGDPLEFMARGSSFSIRKAEAEQVEVEPLPSSLNGKTSTTKRVAVEPSAVSAKRDGS
jgi:ferrous iron transport protein A